ncbi:MAG: TolC family protein [Verrucomicrobiaceae bacterium]|nr:MAG: TolC family protein [Verrucomicrobiaceae bacterium]
MRLLHPFIILLIGMIGFTPIVQAASSVPEQPRIPTFEELLQRPLSLADALNIAAEQNAVILAARNEVEARFGVAVQVRAIVFPKLIARSEYNIRQDSLIEANQNREIPEAEIPEVEIPEIRILLPELGIDRTFGGGTFGGNTVGGGTRPKVNNQMWNAEVRLTQSIYEGGRMLSALRQATLIREQALLDFESVVSDVLLNVRIAYDDAQLAELQIQLREQSVSLLGEIIEKVRIQKAVGVATEFEELRARLEQNNIRSPLATARQDAVIAKQRLVQLMGYDEPPETENDLPLELSTPLRIIKYGNSLSQALVTADLQRPELAAIQVAGKLGDEAIIVAKAGQKPSVQVFASYAAVSRAQSRNIGDPLTGGIAGVQFQWPIFDGFLTRGRVSEAKARREQIANNTDELARQITLQVRSEWARMVEARNIVRIQSSNVQTGARAVELSLIRFTTGISTQVEVLDAQTALLDSALFYANALRNYSVAYSRFLRATGEDLQYTTPPAKRVTVVKETVIKRKK